MIYPALLLIYVHHNWGSDWESAWDCESFNWFLIGFDSTANCLSFSVNLCCSVYFAWWDKDHSVTWWDVFPGVFLFFTSTMITLYFSNLMLISAAALAVPWRQSCCGAEPSCPSVLHVLLGQGINGWLWLPSVYIKTPTILLLWRDDVSLCPLLILPIFYGLSLSIPSYYCGLSLCSPFYLMSHWYICNFFLCAFGLSVPIFFQWFLLPTVWMSLCTLLLGVLWLVFISSSNGQAASPPLWSWVGDFGVHPARQRSSSQSSLKITGAGFVSGWFTDVVTIQVLVRWAFTGTDYSLVSLRNQAARPKVMMQNQDPVTYALWPCWKVLAPVSNTRHSLT